MFSVRSARSEDLAAIVRLEREIATAPHWAEGEYAAILEGSGVRRCLLVAGAGEDLVGFAVGKVVEGEGELESVAVAANSRRLGLGKSLCRVVMAWCSAEGATTIELEVRAGSAGAIRLYERLGFSAVGRRIGYYREPVEDAVLMRHQF